MIIRWLGSVGLSLSVLAGVAAADDGWRPANTSPKALGSTSPTTASGALGVTLGRPMPMDDSPESNATGFATADPNLVRTSYQTPAAPPLFRLQSPEIPQPLPPGPAKTGNANPVSRSKSGFATEPPTAVEPPITIFEIGRAHV